MSLYLVNFSLLWSLSRLIYQSPHQSVIYARGITCNANPEYILIKACFIRARRGKTGLINLHFQNAKPLLDVWISAVLFYRFGTIYRYIFLNFFKGVITNSYYPNDSIKAVACKIQYWRNIIFYLFFCVWKLLHKTILRYVVWQMESQMIDFFKWLSMPYDCLIQLLSNHVHLM